jgi:hypothetical protein
MRSSLFLVPLLACSGAPPVAPPVSSVTRAGAPVPAPPREAATAPPPSDVWVVIERGAVSPRTRIFTSREFRAAWEDDERVLSGFKAVMPMDGEEPGRPEGCADRASSFRKGVLKLSRGEDTFHVAALCGSLWMPVADEPVVTGRQDLAPTQAERMIQRVIRHGW